MFVFRGLPALALVLFASPACEVANPAYNSVHDTTRDAAFDSDQPGPGALDGRGGTGLQVSDVMPGQGGAAGMSIDAATNTDAASDTRRDATSPPDVMPIPPDASEPDTSSIAAEKTIVMVGAGFLTLTSKDSGASWSSMRGGPLGDSTTSYLGAGYAGGKYFAMGWQVITSVDGLTWKPSTLPLQQYFNSIAYGDGTFMMIGGYGTILTSDTGDTWPGNRSHPMGSVLKLHSVAFGGGRFAVSDDNLTVYVTADKGLTWNVLPLKAKFLDYCDGVFRAAIDCKTATTLSRFPKFGLGAFWETRFQDGLYKSPDGTTWQRVYKYPADVHPTDITFGP